MNAYRRQRSEAKDPFCPPNGQRVCRGVRSLPNHRDHIPLQIGDRFGDIEISTLARIGVGRCLIYMGEVAAGVALLDEAMVSVGAEEVSPIAVGDASAR